MNGNIIKSMNNIFFVIIIIIIILVCDEDSCRLDIIILTLSTTAALPSMLYETTASSKYHIITTSHSVYSGPTHTTIPHGCSHTANDDKQKSISIVHLRFLGLFQAPTLQSVGNFAVFP